MGIKKKKIKKWEKETSERKSTVKEDDSYDTEDVLSGFRSQLLRGTYDPRGLGDAGKAAGKKAGQFIAKKLFKHFILTPMFPWLILPMDIYGWVDKVIGSDHSTLWVVCLQLCLHRMLLAAHDISI